MFADFSHFQAQCAALSNARPACSAYLSPLHIPRLSPPLLTNTHIFLICVGGFNKLPSRPDYAQIRNSPPTVNHPLSKWGNAAYRCLLDYSFISPDSSLCLLRWWPLLSYAPVTPRSRYNKHRQFETRSRSANRTRLMILRQTQNRNFGAVTYKQIMYVYWYLCFETGPLTGQIRHQLTMLTETTVVHINPEMWMYCLCLCKPCLH